MVCKRLQAEAVEDSEDGGVEGEGGRGKKGGGTHCLGPRAQGLGPTQRKGGEEGARADERSGGRTVWEVRWPVRSFSPRQPERTAEVGK